MTSIGRATKRHRRRVLSQGMDAYLSWREQCIEVRVAYARWKAAGPSDSELRCEVYLAALDREELASELASELTRRIGTPVVVDFEPVARVFALSEQRTG